MTLNKVFIYSLLFIASLNGLNCKSIRNSRTQKEMYKSIYIDQFRLIYFRKILIKSFNNSKEIQEISKTDHSGFTEPILTESDYKFIDSLTTIDNEKMKIDSTFGNRRAEGSQGKRPFGYILEKIKSKWLDSIAKKRYKNSGVEQLFKD
jgi:hypothetical protein